MKPQIGESKLGQEIGKSSRHRYIWDKCCECGKERWVDKRYIDKRCGHSLCPSCSKKGQHHPNFGKRGSESVNWKGGRIKSHGYIKVLLYPDDFFYGMVDRDGYVMEHRLVMAKYVKRCLLAWEVVHHINGIRNDNRLENLKLLPNSGTHNTLINKHIKGLEKQLARLIKENELLRKGVFCG